MATLTDLTALPVSTRTRKAVVKQFSARYDENGPCHLVAEVRWDDALNNGHNSFAVTATLYRKNSYGREESVAGGCLHELIAEHFPQLVHALPYHLVSADGPLYYLENTLFLAGDRDCFGTRRNEQRKQSTTGLPLWQLQVAPFSVIAAPAKPLPYTVAYAAVIGEGKPPEWGSARAVLKGVKASDEVLSLPEPALKEWLAEHAPALTSTAALNVCYLAGTRDCFGYLAGEQKRSREGALMWRMVAAPYAFVDAAQAPQPVSFEYAPIFGFGKERELDLARKSAIWPDASDEDLCRPEPELRELLLQRLPRIMDEFHTVVVGLGFEY